MSAAARPRARRPRGPVAVAAALLALAGLFAMHAADVHSAVLRTGSSPGGHLVAHLMPEAPGHTGHGGHESHAAPVPNPDQGSHEHSDDGHGVAALCAMAILALAVLLARRAVVTAAVTSGRRNLRSLLTAIDPPVPRPLLVP